MSKKMFFLTSLLMTCLFTFATTFCFAANDNMVNNVENTVDGAVKDVGDTIKDSTNKAENSINKATDNATNYSANRTNTTTTRTAGTDTNTFLGMNSTTWAWVVLAVAAIAIVALVWYYSSQVTNTKRYNDGE